MVRFLKALFPHVAAVMVTAAVGAVVGLVFDVQVIADGGLGPAAAHTGAFVLVLLAAVPALFAFVGALLALALSLVITVLWDLLRRRWRRRTTVRAMTLLGGIAPWIDAASSAPEGGWTAPHMVVFGLLSLTSALLACLVGLVAVQVIPDRKQESVSQVRPG